MTEIKLSNDEYRTLKKINRLTYEKYNGISRAKLHDKWKFTKVLKEYDLIETDQINYGNRMPKLPKGNFDLVKINNRGHEFISEHRENTIRFVLRSILSSFITPIIVAIVTSYLTLNFLK
ncbi:hypothetical protein RD055328_08450 [Companilactobacillus sp. RD055328]|uniref:hypothetical protein n=1 Tax=Companilactobacillus sp. RD055328 TaxID=2916634 RepID=UPI001FC814BB|nr:hypothetical protein [Companilactobacillus sp. RD055328]GKQ42922.1 hypothetical protein RD055328_08450 [Companilactobacillus sp. RD055328]